MQQATITLTPSAESGSVTGFQAMPAMRIDQQKQVTITIDGDDEVAGYLIWFIPAVIGGLALLSGCETNTQVNNTTIINSPNTTSTSPGTQTQGGGSGSGAPRPQ